MLASLLSHLLYNIFATHFYRLRYLQNALPYLSVQIHPQSPIATAGQQIRPITTWCRQEGAVLLECKHFFSPELSSLVIVPT